jgi:ribosomal protein L13
MLPKNKLGSNLYRNLKVFSESDHNITDNNLKEVKFNKI